MSETTIAVDTTLIAAFDAYVLLDAKLSMKAKGLAAILLASGSWAKEEDVTTEDLIGLSTDGRDSVLAGLRELEQAGYLTVVRRTGDGGRIYWQRTMRARPKVAPATEAPATGQPYTALPYTENPSSLESDSSEIASRTINGKSAYGAGGSTSGKKGRTMNGKSGYGAGAPPIRASAHTGPRTGTHAGIRADLGSNILEDLLEEDLNLKIQDQDQDHVLGSKSSSSSTSTRDQDRSTRQGEGSGEREAASLESDSSDNTPDPVLAQLAMQALATCGVRVAAAHLYPRYSFEHIRAEAVRHMERYSTDYARERNAGVLVHRIKACAYLPLTDAERLSTHYLAWRTEQERTADRAALTGKVYEVGGPEERSLESDSSDTAPDLYHESLPSGAVRFPVLVHDRNAPPADPLWEDILRDLAMGGMGNQLAGSAAVRTADNSWLVYITDARNLDWLNNRGAKQIARKLGPSVGVPASAITVAFTASRETYMEATGVH